ncbi:G-D-S-L family lipolytic protein [Elizabethkingia meningoseptica]|uniref:SGNH/GDSL hydrolase family protein n=1 Tax=Elizabethkingia meningoseptica TaxID=238 RepID=UPI0009992778|nr:SGNH/GDSL hydrolase family protein [Elizabethkingia meningoseptica]MCL1675841.1 SGNH/GDSL hydrolase family protein [Elizabethkingia meningoseptica]MCL1687705.1 SGNH/GDSL hydrolase family protein [Elizabethkingia meningoseptica]OPC37249.1 G-D-S-L family lipolytic protein [Elizabethkingia meningoseptica]
MKKYILTSLSAASLLFVSSCKTDFDQNVADIKPTSGDADFSNYISLGNSLTSGFRDNALYIDGQNESYPSIIASQMKRAGGGDFVQPLMADNNGGLVLGPVKIQDTKLYLKGFNADGTPNITNVEGVPTTDITKKITGKLNNFGVPGAKSFHLVAPGYGSLAGVSAGKANPYYVRFSSSTTSTVAGDAASAKPTFFSLWIGNNDVLSYATGGGVGKNQKGNTDPTTYGSEDITEPAVLAASIEGVIKTMAAAGATKGVIANIPNVSTIPYFITVPYNPLSASNPSFGPMIPQLNTTFGALNQAFKALGVPERSISFSTTGSSAVVIKDKDLKDISASLTAALTPSLGIAQATLFGSLYGQARQATSNDFIVLPASSLIGKVNTTAYANFKAMGLSDAQAGQLSVNGVTYPLEDKLVLTQNEQKNVSDAVTAYNAAIAGLAQKYNLAFVDANKKMAELGSQSGIQWNGVKYSVAFITGGAFSLDGVHLTGRGYAVIANEFIKAINTTYKSTLTQVNPNDYSGVKFP